MFYCTLFTIIKIAYLYYVPMLLEGKISFGQRAGCAGGRKKERQSPYLRLGYGVLPAEDRGMPAAGKRELMFVRLVRSSDRGKGGGKQRTNAPTAVVPATGFLFHLTAFLIVPISRPFVQIQPEIGRKSQDRPVFLPLP